MDIGLFKKVCLLTRFVLEVVVLVVVAVVVFVAVFSMLTYWSRGRGFISCSEPAHSVIVELNEEKGTQLNCRGALESISIVTKN